jgi:hypothetical protein
MTEIEQDPIIERIAREARRPVAIDPAAKARLMSAVRNEFTHARPAETTGSPRRAVAMSTPGFAALAAGLVGIGVLLGMGTTFGRDGRKTGQPAAVAETPKQLPASDTVVTFVFPAGDAARVSVVGDFNQWSATATPMKRVGNSDYWSVTVPMSVGRHLYSFLAVGKDGEKWSADPYAPAAPDDGFGRANSVMLVGKGSAL